MLSSHAFSFSFSIFRNRHVISRGHSIPYLSFILLLPSFSISYVFVPSRLHHRQDPTNTPPSANIPAYTLIATQTPPLPSPSSPSAPTTAPDFTAIVLNLIRLEEQSTDILITINVPHIRGEYNEEDVDLQLGKQGRLIGDAVEFAARCWETFKIKDWGLFNEV